MKAGSRVASPLRYVAWLLIAAAALAVPTRPLAAQQTGVVVGVVVDDATGQPLADARVRIAGAQTAVRTDQLGRFRLPGLPAGSHQLVVERLGHETLTLSGVTVAAGQTADAGLIRLAVGPIVLDQVQATATRDPRSIRDVPALVDVVGRESIDRQGKVELTQALENVPGLVNSAQLHNFKSVMLRGMPRTGNEFTTTLLMIDGVPQTDSRNSARVVNLPINDLNAIEVVRGPNSALYGRTAIGGVVNVLTRQPTPVLQTEWDLQGGEFGYLKALGAVSGPIGGRSGFYVSGSTSRNTGYYEQDYDFEVRQHSLFSKFTFAPDDRSNAMISANYVLSDNGVPTPVPIVDGRPLHEVDPSFSRFRNLNVPSSNYHQRELRATLNYTRALTDRLSISEVFGFRKIRYQFEEDGDDVALADLESQTLFQYTFEQTTDEDIYYNEVRLRVDAPVPGVENSLQIGVTAEYNDGYSAGNLIYTDEDELGWPLNYANPVWPDRSEWQYFRFGGNDYHLTSGALYAQYSVEPLPWLIVDAGARYDKAWLRNVERFRDGQPRTEDDFDAFSPKLSTTFRLLRERPTGALGNVSLNAFATYSQAFLAPRVPSGLRVADAEVELVPEDIDNYEAGVKGTLLGGRLAFEGAYFRMTRDGIVVNTRVGPLFRPSNAGKQEFRGFETGLTLDAGRGFSLFANGAFYRHRFGHFVIEDADDPADDIVLTDNKLPFSPDRIVNAGVSWTHDASGFGWNVNVKNVGERYVDQGNTVLLDPTTTVDAAITWRRNRLRLTLSALNLTDEAWVTSGSISSGSSVEYAPPRQILLTGSISTR